MYNYIPAQAACTESKKYTNSSFALSMYSTRCVSMEALKYASILLLLFATAQAQRVQQYVKCDHTTEYCECKSIDDNSNLECHFGLEIEQRQTFTRYTLDNERQIPGFGGVVVYFDGDGVIQDYPPEGASPTVVTPTPAASELTSESAPGPSPSPTTEPRPSTTVPITVDGYTFRAIITVNSRFPGPTLIVPKNAIVVVDVSNTLDSESISIHWHGMHQINTPWMDGVEHITQCGIAPSSSFRYIFRAYPAGTHWYHSHSGAQRTDGLFGALIVKEDIAERILYTTYDIEGMFVDDPTQHAMTLIDWQLKDSLELFTQIHGGIRFFNETRVPSIDNDPREPRTCSPDGVEVGPVTFWSGLINGRGRYRYVPYIKTRLSTFNVQPDTSYRFRLIGAQSLFAFRFSIDEHELMLIATDGHFVNLRRVDFIIIHSGERYDFILKTKADSERTKDNFIIRAETLEVNCDDDNLLKESQLYTDHMAEGILHYGGREDVVESKLYNDISMESIPKSKECSRNSKCRAVNCPFQNFPMHYNIDCIPIHTLLRATETFDEEERNRRRPMFTTSTSNTLFFNFGFEGTERTSSINGRNFRFPSSALQLATQDVPRCDMSPGLCNTVRETRNEACMCTQILDIQPYQSYRFVFTAVGPNRALWNFSHPVHLHGHSFYVTEIGFGSYDENSGRVVSASDKIECGTSLCTNPRWSDDPDKFRSGQIIDTVFPRKDTILIPAGGYAVVYIISDNPGYWFLHCHIEVHQLEGMSLVINEAPRRHNAPPPNLGQCNAFSWDVDEFLNKVQSPSPIRPYPPFFVNFIISTTFAGLLGILFVALLLVVVVTACCYFYCTCDCPCKNKKSSKYHIKENTCKCDKDEVHVNPQNVA